MMGAHHAVCGAAAWLAVSTKVHVDLSAVTSHPQFGPVAFDLGLGLLHLGPVGVLAGALVTAGAALVPDADHHSATIAHSLPPLSNMLCGGVESIAGGHRHGTHSLLGIAAFTVIAWFAGLWVYPIPHLGTVNLGAGILAVVLIAFAAKALRLIPDSRTLTPWVVGLLGGALITFIAPTEQWWLPLAMVLGVTVHILGDMLTTGGVNLLWPLVWRPPTLVGKSPVLGWMWKPNGYLAVPVLGDAGSVREWILLVPLSLYTAWGLFTAVTGSLQIVMVQLNLALRHLMA